MKVKTKNEINGKSLKYLNMYNALYERKVMVFYGGSIAVALVVAGYFTYNAIKNSKVPTGWVFLALAILMAVYMVLQIFRIEKINDKYIFDYLRKQGGPYDTFATLDEEKIIFEVPRMEFKSEHNWNEVSKVIKFSDYYFIDFKAGERIFIDRSLEAILEGSSNELEELMEKKIGERQQAVLDATIHNKEAKTKKPSAEGTEGAEGGETPVKVEVPKFKFIEVKRKLFHLPFVEYVPVENIKQPEAEVVEEKKVETTSEPKETLEVKEEPKDKEEK